MPVCVKCFIYTYEFYVKNPNFKNISNQNKIVFRHCVGQINLSVGHWSAKL